MSRSILAIALALTLYLMKHDRKLLERRISGGPVAEKEPVQKIKEQARQNGMVTLLEDGVVASLLLPISLVETKLLASFLSHKTDS
jgi:hypothetical protein